jgi:membrane-associated phospholipid phosphatase
LDALGCQLALSTGDNLGQNMKRTTRIALLIMAIWLLSVIVLLAAFPQRAMAQEGNQDCEGLKKQISPLRDELVHEEAQLKTLNDRYLIIEKEMLRYKELIDSVDAEDRAKYRERYEQTVLPRNNAKKELIEYKDHTVQPLRDEIANLSNKLATCGAKKPGDKLAQNHACGSSPGKPKEGVPPPEACHPQEAVADSRMSIKKVIFNLPGDQKAIWTSPLHLRKRDFSFVVPLLASTGGLIGSDHHSMSRAQSKATDIKRSNTVSNFGLGGVIAVPVFMYAWGSYKGNPRFRETGLLSGEALLDSLAFSEALKPVFARQRPTLTDGQGHFFQGPGNSSFPSGHATLSWAVASVIAHEYPGPLTKFLVYGAASVISISRVTGRKHFPADVVVASASGWLIGRHVFRAHHDRDLDTADYGVFDRARGEFDPSKLGSSFVPLDSWVYPALKRLAALGYIKTQFTGLEPWTRRECLRQIEEADDLAQDLPPDSDVPRTVRALKAEFSQDGQHYESAQIESIYTRYGNIAGTPLRDSYHFGQTIWDDFGRPYDQGSNVITGASARAVAGPFFFYVRGEYQHAPGRLAYTFAQRSLISVLDQTPIQAATPVASTDRFQPVEMYAGVQLGQYALTFGKQSLWLGPGESSPLMVSDNADPMYMLRFTRTSPFVLPWIFRHLGKGRTEFVFAKPSGHQFPARPFFNLQKVSFQVTDNLEIGFTRAAMFWGVGHPATFHSFIRNFTTTGGTVAHGFPDPNKFGDFKSGFDFSYRLPKLRNWLTLYCDYYSDDEPTPLHDPGLSTPNPGLYLSHFPKLSKLDLRVEGVSSQYLTSFPDNPRAKYWDNQYRDANTNNGFLFGNPTGRDGRSYQVWSTYHFSAVTNLQLSYREVKTSSKFVPGGGTQNDASIRFLWQARPEWSVNAFVQYERWLIPALRPTAQQNITSQVQVTFRPHWEIHRD